MIAEPKLKYCTVREGDSEWHLECRFSDGQKYAAIKIDGDCPQLATRIAALLNGNAWTNDRPTEPGEYWLSLQPNKRQCHAPVLKVILEHNRTNSLHVRVVGDDAGWLGLSCGGWLDGAKWSRRETPADPFEEG